MEKKHLGQRKIKTIDAGLMQVGKPQQDILTRILTGEIFRSEKKADANRYFHRGSTYVRVETMGRREAESMAANAFRQIHLRARPRRRKLPPNSRKKRRERGRARRKILDDLNATGLSIPESQIDIMVRVELKQRLKENAA